MTKDLKSELRNCERRNAGEFSGPKVISDGPKDVFYGQTSPHFRFFWEKRTLDSMCQRWKRSSRLLPTKSAKTSLCDGMELHQCSRHGWSAYMWRYHWCRNMLLSRWQLFPGTPCLFQQDNARPHSAQVTTTWLCRHRVQVLDWPACSLDLSPIENAWRIMRNRQKFSLQNCNNWSSVPKRLQSVV